MLARHFHEVAAGEHCPRTWSNEPEKSGCLEYQERCIFFFAEGSILQSAKYTWPDMSACHAGLLADNRTPVGSVQLLSAQMPAGFACRLRIRPLRFRPRAYAVDDVTSRFGEVLLAYPLALMASLSPSDVESSQDNW